MKKTKLKTDSFSNLLAVFAWLQKAGWKISRAGIYKHQKEGKIRQHTDGIYLTKDIHKYAHTFLKRRDTGKRLQDEHDDLQRRKTQLEVEKLEVEVAKAKRRREVEEGKYIPADQMHLELAARAGVLDAGINHWVQSNAAGWIHLAGGNLKKVGELIAAMTLGKNELMNQYATTKEFCVIFEGEEEDQG